ncbi:hypothetical protein jhhlp_007281 [Lomentospora prolificans]|uniref:Helicase C-terminal domain-containing protein n=1 Tax=Lomentospora prolificans TaxID=41688 RepID=A0A2N3N290_9PEZI|nr:hypothetical protein jhhlp_007281 [Lomentospora prolificans]
MNLAAKSEFRAVPALDSYLPLGCLCVPEIQTGLSREQFAAIPSERGWLNFNPPMKSSRLGGTLLNTNSDKAFTDTEADLSRCSLLKPLQGLLLARWIRIDYRLSADKEGLIFRVYLLPDDIERRSVDRENVRLKKARRQLLARLDFSPGVWLGIWPPANAERVSSPRLSQPKDSKSEPAQQSLLTLFNNIPSPSPQPECLVDPHASEAAYNLLDSKVPGLTTTLYPYQRRSAAAMLEKETNPGRSIDPRLESVLDQEGKVWYYDESAGVVLKEPRLYDGVSGGILAEEMGAGKTIICLSLILATKHLYPLAPDIYRGATPVRPKVGSLVDMAASFITRNSVPWEYYLKSTGNQYDFDFSRCIRAIHRHPGHYFCPEGPPAEAYRVTLRGRGRGHHDSEPAQAGLNRTTIYLSKATVIIVPNNLVVQWCQEIKKHTQGLKVLTIARFLGPGRGDIPDVTELLEYDVILIAQTRFEALYTSGFGNRNSLSLSPLGQMHFKRCIVDEGHKLGGSKIRQKSNLLLGIETLRFSSRWIVTGTPAKGLYGLDGQAILDEDASLAAPSTGPSQSEAQDLDRIGAMAALYLKARPWANTLSEPGDTPADWAVYVMQPHHSSRSRARTDSLRSTLNSLIIRHRVAEVAKLLPPVEEKVVVLEGSYQDKLSLNIFAMYIIFNSVQSQRADQDYFFHPRQRKALLQLVHNLRQASFFGGSFFSVDDLRNGVETAEAFLEKRDVPISNEDEALLKQAIAFGRIAICNEIRTLSNQFHEIPLHVHAFPGSASQAWSLNNKDEDPMLTDAPLLLELQKIVRKHINSPVGLNSLMNGGLVEKGIEQRSKALTVDGSDGGQPNSRLVREATLAGNAKLGDTRSPQKSRAMSSLETLQSEMKHMEEMSSSASEHDIPASLADTTVTATSSAKMSYLIDSITKYQAEEQIIVFYDNDNVAWYIASLLDVFQITYLIYAKSLTTEKKAQYVNSFNHSSTFRVLLMDTTQAAFGLDMWAASRIYFISPVLNPQVEAQAVGRARRISRQKPVSVETLVLRDSVDEVILSRRQNMTQAEHRKVKSILDDRPIYNWILNAKIVPLPDTPSGASSQMASLRVPQLVFGKGFGRIGPSDEGLMVGTPLSTASELRNTNGIKRPHSSGPAYIGLDLNDHDLASRPARRVRFTAG